MKNFYASLLFFFSFIVSFAQPRLYHTEFTNQSGTGGSADYSTGFPFEGLAFNSYRLVTSVATNGDKFFRFRNAANTNDRRPNADGDVVPLNASTPYTSIFDGAFYAFKFNATTGRRYVFKVDGPVNNLAIFEIQGTNIETVSSVTRSPSGTVFPGLDVTVTATLSGAFSTGQAAYLRYTNDGFSTSTIVKMTGSGTTYTATIPASVNTPSANIVYYVFTSGDVSSISHANADLYTINANNNGGLNYSYTVASGWTTAAAGNWGTGSTWTAGVAPPTTLSMGNVTIAHNVTLNQNAVVGAITVNTGVTLTGADASARTLTIQSGGTFTKNGTFTPTTNSTVIFNGSGTFTSSTATTFNNLHIGGALSGTGVSTATVNNNFQINAGGSVSTSPIYGTSSTLIYNTGGSYNVSNEWTATTDGTAAAGRPQNVTIANSTTLNMPSSTRSMAGNLLVESGSTLNLNTSSGDLMLRGNWTNNGTFNPNSRAVFFMGASSSQITRTGGETFNYLILNKTGGNLVLNNNVTINASVGDVLQMLGGATSTTIGAIDLNGNNLILSGSGGNIFLGTHTAATTRNIVGSGEFRITGYKTITRTANATLLVSSASTLVYSAGLNCGTGNLLTVNGTMRVDAGGYIDVNSPIYGASSTLVYNTGSSYGVNLEWTATADGPAGLGLPNNVTIQNSTTVNMPINFRAMAGNLTINNGCTFVLNASAGDFSLRGNWYNDAGTFTHNNRFVAFRGATNSTVQNTASGGETFYQLIVQKTAAVNLQLLSNVTLTANTGGALQLLNTVSGGGIDLNGFNLTLNNAGGNIDIGTGTSLARNISGNGNLIINAAKSVVRGGSSTNTLTTAAGVNIQLNDALTISAAFVTINGTLTINAGGSVLTTTPTYGATSHLIYNQGGSITHGVEWTATTGGAAGAGRPADLTIQNSSTLSLTANRGIARHLTINSGSTLSLDAPSGAIFVGGNWTRQTGATFNHNSRLVTLGGVNLASSINAPTSEIFGPLTINKTVATTYLDLNCDVEVNGAFTMAANAGRLRLNNQTITFNGNITTTATSGVLSSTGNGSVVVNGSGGSATLHFLTSPAENVLSSLTINRSSSGLVNLATNLEIDNGSGLNNSVLILNNGWLQVNTGNTLTVANTSITGSASSFVFTQTTGRMAYRVTGAGTYNLEYPIGSAANTSSFRPFQINNLVQTATNTYTVGATAGAATAVSSTYSSPVVAVSMVRYYPVNFGTLSNITSVGSVGLTAGVDDVPPIDVLTIAQETAGTWENRGRTVSNPSLTNLPIDLSSASTHFTFAFTGFPIIYFSNAGSDANSGQNPTNVPPGTGPKATMTAAIAAVANGGTIQSTATSTYSTAFTIDKNINIVSGSGTLTITTSPVTVTAKSVHPFQPADINTSTDEITLNAHQLATGMPVTFSNYGNALGFMPSAINTATDIITVGSNVPTGQPVIYQAYPATGAAGGLTHGTTYYAINVSATQIRLAATYNDAINGTPIIDITSTGSAQSHAVIVSVPQGLLHNTQYFVIVVDANTIKLAATNADALTNNPIDLLTIGGGNHVIYFTPSITGTITGTTTLNINNTQAYVGGFLPLTNASISPTITLTSGTYQMQPTFNLNRILTLNGAGISNTIWDGGGKISSADNYFGINFAQTAALTTVTISNMALRNYYVGIHRNSTFNNTTTNIDFVECSDNFRAGILFGGTGSIVTALNIRNGIFNNNNGVGLSSYGVLVSGPTSKSGVNIRDNTFTGNGQAAIEIGAGTTPTLFIRNNTITGSNVTTPTSCGVTEFGIIVTGVAPTGSNSNISNNEINMFGRAGIECRGCTGNSLVSGANSFRITSNYINQAGGPFRFQPGTSAIAENRDLAGIAVGNILSSGVSAGMVIDTNQIVGIQQPNSVTTAFTAFGIVAAGANMRIRANIVDGCEIGIQAQQGGPGNENATPDNFYSSDNTASTTGWEANRNSIINNTDFGARNQGVAGPIDFIGNWWGHPTGPTHAANILPAGSGQPLPAGTGIAYNVYMSVDPDDVPGTASGQRGIQVQSAKNFRLKPTSNATSLSAPYILQQGVLAVHNNNFTDTVDVYPATYNIGTTTVNLNRRVYMRGNFGNTLDRPIATGTGDLFPGGTGSDATSTNTSIFYVSTRHCGIENFRIDVNVPLFGSGARIGILTGNASGTFSRLRIKNNVIQNIGVYAFGSWGVYLGNNAGGSYGDTVFFEGNRISNRVLGGTNSSTFGRGIRAWYCNVQLTGNTIISLYSVQHGNPRGTIGNTITNNVLCGNYEINGIMNGFYTLTNNSMRADSVGSFKSHAAIIEIRDNQVGGSGLPILIQDNHFRNVGAGGGALGPYAIYSTMANNVTVRNNTFTPNPTTPFFAHVHVNTKHQSTAPLTAFANGINIRGNTFLGNAVSSDNKYGIVFGNHNNTGSFAGGVTIGTASEPNIFKTEISRFIYLCGFNGSSSSVPAPPFNSTIPTTTPTSPVSQNFDARHNIFGVSGIDKAPGSMTLTELFEVEDKIFHKIDFAALGFVTILDNNVYVTNNSFFTPYTTSKLIQRGVDHASDGWTVNIQSGTYSETVTVTKTLDFTNDGPTNIQELTMNGTSKTLTLNNDFNITSTLTLTNGWINTGTNTLRVTNPAAAAISGGSNTSHIIGRLARSVNTGLLYNFPVGDGTNMQLAGMNFTTVSGLSEVTVRFTNSAPGMSISSFYESGVNFDDVLQDGYWIIEPNPGGNSTNYELRLSPQGFTNYDLPFPKSYTIMKRVGASPWGQDGSLLIPPSPPNNKVFADGSVRRSGLSGFSNFSIGSGDETTLPITVVDFQAQRNNRTVDLLWTSTLEKDVQYFELERSQNGFDFVSIARVTPTNKGAVVSHYSYEDKNVFSKPGQIFYYRLKAIEFGKSTFISGVKAVQYAGGVDDVQLILQPNPTGDFITITGSNVMAQPIILTDISGKIVYSTPHYDGKAISVKHLPSGVYFVKVLGANEHKKVKLIKE